MKKLSAIMKCLVVDDEPLAAGLICSYVETVPELELAGACHSALDALTLLRQQPIDLIFLDIQMPRLTGLEFLRTLTHPPAVIITTAYREYAVEGFELDVVDYLVKPVTLERFLKAIGKVIHRLQHTPLPAPGMLDREPERLYQNSAEGWPQPDHLPAYQLCGREATCHTFLTYPSLLYCSQESDHWL
jgi:DNA-binding LytR/AlgR family response regulator